MLARVATRDEKKPLVVVLLVVTALVVVEFPITALVAVRLVAKKLVEVPLVITEVEAKMFCAKRLRNLLRLVPSV